MDIQIGFEWMVSWRSYHILAYMPYEQRHIRRVQEIALEVFPNAELLDMGCINALTREPRVLCYLSQLHNIGLVQVGCGLIQEQAINVFNGIVSETTYQERYVPCDGDEED